MTNFIFMLTHNDVTVPNALEVFEEIENTEVRARQSDGSDKFCT